MSVTCGFRGMRSFCVYVAAYFVRHSGCAEEKSVLGDMAFPSFLDGIVSCRSCRNPSPAHENHAELLLHRRNWSKARTCQ